MLFVLLKQNAEKRFLPLLQICKLKGGQYKRNQFLRGQNMIVGPGCSLWVMKQVLWKEPFSVTALLDLGNVC